MLCRRPAFLTGIIHSDGDPRRYVLRFAAPVAFELNPVQFKRFFQYVSISLRYIIHDGFPFFD